MVLRALLLTLAIPGLSFAQATSEQPQRDAKLDPAFVIAHDRALAEARVWAEPKTPIAEANLGTSPQADDGFREDAVVDCRFKVEGVGGSTPKFRCELPGGDDFKVKYGAGNEEIYTEVLATRLLGALGFPTDRMYPVARVRCAGCSADPYKDLQCLNEGKPKEVCFANVDYSRVQEFEHAVIERTIDGRRIETRRARGWDWKELSKIDPTAGGSPRAHVDALRLMAVFLAHWDNKAKNQRLLCAGEDEDENEQPTADCDRPMAMIQDLGGTFGPHKLDLRKWSATPIWADAPSCRVSMRALPYGGSTFPDATISEDGRLFLANLLRQLSRDQVRSLFAGAGIADFPHRTAAAREAEPWVDAFAAKVDAIVNRAPCPPPSGAATGR